MIRGALALVLVLATPALASPVSGGSSAPVQEPVAEESAPSPPQVSTAVTASFVLQVGQPIEAADTLSKAAAELGGWFQARTQDRLELRVPVARVDELLTAAGVLGRLTDRSVQRTDLTRDLVEIDGQLRTRREGLQRYFDVLETADKGSVFAVQSRVLSEIQTIEGLEGRRRVLVDRASFARVEVSFRFRDRAAPAPTGASSFAWLNSLNVQDVRAGLRTERPKWRTRGFAIRGAPEGFSAWRRLGRYRAASPDGVLLRARGVKHDPRASVAFWREAVRERMVAAGYRVVRDEDVRIGAEGGGLIELQAPLGDEDWTYQIVFVPRGRRVAIIEAAGEVSRFEARRSAIEAMVQGLSL